MPLHDTVLDHVAIAVSDLEAAADHWYGLGAVPVAGSWTGVFRTEQVRLGNGAKLELIAPLVDGPPSFVDAFLERFGPGRIHHVTIKTAGGVPAAVEALAADGVETVDVNTDYPHWHEAFIRPSRVGGLVAQVAWADGTDVDFAARMGRPTPPDPDPAAPHLAAVQLQHEDPAAAADFWTLLGATVSWTDDARTFTAEWPDSPLAIQVRHGPSNRPLGLVVPELAPAAQTPRAPVLIRPRS